MKPNILGLSAVGWHAMTDSAWERVLAYLLLASFILAVLYVVYRLGRYGLRRYKVSRPLGPYINNQPSDDANM